MQCRSARENLREIGGGTEAGRILINKNIDKYKQISIINLQREFMKKRLIC